MGTICGLLILAVLCWILWSAYKQHRANVVEEQRARRERMDAHRAAFLTAEEERAWKRIKAGYKTTAKGEDR